MRRLISFFMAILMSFHFACSSSQRPPVLTPYPVFSSLPDASQVIPVDVILLGLPETSIPHSDDAGLPRVEGGQGLFPAGVGEVITPLHRGAVAPFNGVLFNGPAVARVSVEFRALQSRCLIERRHDTDLLIARYTADLASLRLALDTQVSTDRVLLNGRDADIARLQRVIQGQRPANGPHIGEGLIWAGGGLVVGALLVGGIVISTNIRP